MFLVQCTNLSKIDHKFFEPGHSYMECDRSFALIEKNKKKNLQIFIPDHWVDTIKNTTKKFKVKNMTTTDFISFQYLHEIMKDPKKDTEKNLLRWRDIVWFAYRKEQFMSFSFKVTRNKDFPFYTSENCSRVKKGRPSLKMANLTGKLLYATQIKIAYVKWENLMTLLEFIPPVYHNFYTNLPHETKNNKSKEILNNTKKLEQDREVKEEGDRNLEDDDGSKMVESDYDE